MTAAALAKSSQKSPALFYFPQINGIHSLAELRQKIIAMQSDYYALGDKIVSAEKKMTALGTETTAPKRQKSQRACLQYANSFL